MVRRVRPTTGIAAGATLHRVHARNREPRFYGRHDATWRWDDPNGAYGVLYVGLTQEGPIAETLLRRAAQKQIVWSQVEKRRWASFRATEALRLADLHGKGLSWLGGTVAEVSADHVGTTYPGAYTKAQAICGRRSCEHGFGWPRLPLALRPRSVVRCLVDRADHKIELIEEGVPIDRSWVEGLLESHGKEIIDL
jgi:hypothetical protein